MVKERKARAKEKEKENNKSMPKAGRFVSSIKTGLARTERTANSRMILQWQLQHLRRQLRSSSNNLGSSSSNSKPLVDSSQKEKVKEEYFAVTSKILPSTVLVR